MKKISPNFLADLPSSIVVFLVALPLCLGIALGSQTPLFSGIISGIIGGIVIGFLSNSPLSVSGPAAGLIAIVIMGLQKLGSFEALLLATLIAGIFQIIFGFLKLGTLGDFIPNSVIKGMLAAIGLILILKQIPHFVGYDSHLQIDEAFVADEQNKIIGELSELSSRISPLACAIGLLCLLILIAFEHKKIKKNKYLKNIPAPLIAVIIGAAINYNLMISGSIYALQQEHLVFLPELKHFSDLSSVLAFPEFGAIFNPDIWLVALTIAIVASIETLLCIEATDKLDPFKRRTDCNRELKAQGTGNIFAGLIGGLPITSVIVRSSANVNSGAHSKLSTILHGAWLLLAIMLIPGLINMIPYSSLAAILIFTGFKLARPQIFKELYKLGLDQFIPFVITIIAILMTNLLLGIAVGILSGLITILHSNFKSSIMLVHKDNNYLIRLRKDVSFLNKAKLKKTLAAIPPYSNLVIDISRSDFIDKDVIEVINDFCKSASLNKIHIDIKKNNFQSLHRLIHH